MRQNEWNLIDFHAKFTEEYMQWCVEHQERLQKDDADTDALFYEMYIRWLDEPKAWLEGASPRGYFTEMQDAAMLVSAFMEYILHDMEVPDPLAERLVEEADAVYPIFLNILMDDHEQQDMSAEQLDEIRAQVLPLIGEMHKPHPYVRYIQLLSVREEEDALGEQLTEALMEVADQYSNQLVQAYAYADGYGRTALLDLFSRMYGEQKALRILTDALEEPDADIVFLAGCLGRLGDPRGAEALKKLVHKPGLDYFAFKEIQNAVDELTGEQLEEQDFSGDALYEYLKGEYDEE